MTCTQRAAILLGMLGLCGLTRWWLIAHTAAVSPDGPTYLAMARQWGESPRQVAQGFDYAVGYPAAISMTHAVLPRLSWERCGQIVSLAGAEAAMTALWVLAEIAFDWRVAMVTTLILGVTHKWAVLGADVMSDALAIALSLWSAVLALWAMRGLQRRENRAVGWAALAGLSAGLGYLVRPESLGMLAVAIGLWGVGQFRQRLDWRRTVAAAVTATLAAALCAGPYIATIGSISKKKHLDRLLQLPRLRSMPLAAMEISKQGFSAPRALVAQLGETMNWVLFGLAAVWLFARVWDRMMRRRRAPWILPALSPPAALLMLGTAALYAPLAMTLYDHAGYLDYRHVMLLAMVLSPLAGAGGVFLADAVQARLRRPQGRGVAAAKLAVLGLVVALFLGHTLRPLHEEKGKANAAGLRAH